MVNEQHSFMLNVCSLIVFIHFAGYQVTGGELYRTKEQQEIYFKEGKTKTKYSRHMDRMAIDLQIFKDGKWLKDKKDLQIFGDYWETLHPKNRWGGNFTDFIDVIHFERRA